jgi:outer membrane protein assembly factor BamB
MLTRATRLPARNPLLLRSCLALVPAALVLAGCESGPAVHAGPERSPEDRRKDFPTPYEEYGRLGYRLDWVGYPTVTGSLPVTFFEPYDDMTVVLERGSALSILEPNTGSRRCSTPLANPITKFTGISRDPDRLLISSDADVFIIDPRTCNLTARQRIQRVVSTEPAKYGDLLIFGSPSGEVFAHISSLNVSGVKAWGYLTSGSIEKNPVMVGSIVGVVSQAGDVVFLDAQTGSLMAHRRVFGGLATNPVADEQVMYFAGLDQSVWAFDARGGSQVWRYRTGSPLRTQPTLHGGRLYVGIPGEGLVAFDAATGEVAWKAQGLENAVIVAMNKGRLIGFDAQARQGVSIGLEHGDVIERIGMPGVTMVKADRFENGNLFAVSASGVVAKFQPR